MPSYCVTKGVVDTGEHIVHRLDVDCALLPSEDQRHDLGPIADDDEAISVSAQTFGHVDGCPECMTDRNDHVTRQAIDASIAALITVSNM